MWTLNLYIFVYWLLYIQFITSPQWKYIDAFRLELKWLSYLFLFKSNMLFTLLLILSSYQQFYLNLIIHSHPSKALCCQPTLFLDMVSHLTPSRPELYMGREKLWTQTLHTWFPCWDQTRSERAEGRRPVWSMWCNPGGAYLRQESHLPHKVILTAMFWKCKWLGHFVVDAIRNLSKQLGSGMVCSCCVYQ